MTDFTYGCNNGKRPVANAPILVQDGWHTGIFDYEDGSSDRIPRMVPIPFVMSTECQYDASATDSACKGCAHAPHLRPPAK
jgi:hypothetical protein